MEISVTVTLDLPHVEDNVLDVLNNMELDADIEGSILDVVTESVHERIGDLSDSGFDGIVDVDVDDEDLNSLTDSIYERLSVSYTLD